MHQPHDYDYDVLIIGAGSAGLAALRAVRRRTQRFALIDQGPWGTTCARVGCMPSKLLLEAAHAGAGRAPGALVDQGKALRAAAHGAQGG